MEQPRLEARKGGLHHRTPMSMQINYVEYVTVEPLDIAELIRSLDMRYNIH